MQEERSRRHLSGKVVRDFGRAAGGALIFCLPMLMTMELWWLGFYLDRVRLLVLMFTVLPLLFLLSRYIGFEKTNCWQDDVFDVLMTLGIAAVVCSCLLVLFGTISFDTPFDEVAGKIAIQMVPASIGALLAKSQFAAKDEDGMDEPDETYGGELFLMSVGALFLGFNMAPTEEMMLISYQMTHWHAVALVVLSLILMHGFVFAVGFAGGSEVSNRETWWDPFVRLTLPGYVIALSVSVYLLWIFARTDGMEADAIVMAAVVLAFPSSIGAAAARLIL